MDLVTHIASQIVSQVLASGILTNPLFIVFLLANAVCGSALVVSNRASRRRARRLNFVRR